MQSFFAACLQHPDQVLLALGLSLLAGIIVHVLSEKVGAAGILAIPLILLFVIIPSAITWENLGFGESAFMMAVVPMIVYFFVTFIIKAHFEEGRRRRGYR